MLKPVMDTCSLIAAVQMLKGSREQPLPSPMLRILRTSRCHVVPGLAVGQAAVSW